jgi:hypothetical protein
MKQILAGRNDGRAMFTFDAIDKVSGDKKQITKSGISRLEDYTQLMRKESKLYLIKWA